MVFFISTHFVVDMKFFLLLYFLVLYGIVMDFTNEPNVANIRKFRFRC